VKYSRAVPVWVNLLQWYGQLRGSFSWSGRLFGGLRSVLVVVTRLACLIKEVECWLVPVGDRLIPEGNDMMTCVDDSLRDLAS
jgi:hypothetical protein